MERHRCSLGDVADLPFGLFVIERRRRVPGLPDGPSGALKAEKLTRHLGRWTKDEEEVKTLCGWAYRITEVRIGDPGDWPGPTRVACDRCETELAARRWPRR